jgi:PadR family transcriptional regulator PadR
MQPFPPTGGINRARSLDTRLSAATSGPGSAPGSEPGTSPPNKGRTMRRTRYLGEFEQLVLLAILRLQGQAYGPAIAAELEERAGRRVSRGALYGTLDRLERKGCLDWSLEPGTEERGGQPLRRFQVTESGLETLRAAQAVVQRLKAGLEDILSENG